MSILLDFDMDFFVRPIYKESRDNHRDYLNEPCQLMPMKTFFQTLANKNLCWKESDVKIFTSHKKSYTFWWTRKYKNCTLIHIDAHSDFYRPKGRDLMAMGNHEITCYNYIWYAVRDGYVKKIYWVLPEDHELMLRLKDFKSEATEKSETLPFSIDLDIPNSNDLDTPFSAENSLLKSALDIIHHGIDSRMPSRGILYSHSIYLECPVNTVNGALHLEIIICPIDALPSFSEPILFVTAATSPEFISADADKILPEFCECLQVSEEMCRNIQSQHEDMKISL